MGKDTILAKYAKMAKAGACQELETPAVVAEELYPKTGKILFFTVNGKGEIKMLYDTIIPAFGFLIVCLLIYREAQKW